MTLNDFWPPVDEDHTTKCLVTEAETAANEVFLAVHQPMRLTRELFSVENAAVETQSEQQLLDALLADEPPSGTLIIPIVGDSGVGKSHMIRWLDAHLRLRKDAGSRHVVRIPKSSSLRGVLELILKDLPAKRYSELHQKLKSARMPPSRPEAMRLLQAKLLSALESEGKAAADRLNTPNRRVDDRAKAAHCSRNGLMALLQDPAIEQHFTAHEGEQSETWGVLTRIADRCLHGSRRNDDGPLNQFLASDFAFISDVPDASLAAITRRYLPILRRPAELEMASNFLNGVIDQALAGLVDLGGISLADIFIEIRRAMLADNLELVLLVEDFAVLAGIQGPLLDAMIREAIRDGKRELCTMRTALAVTEGKLPEETVKTRAQWKWKIDSHPFKSEGEAMDTFQNFAGSYLNAARWGAAKLLEIFDERHDGSCSLSDWVPNFYESHRQDLSEAENEQLRAFGFSSRGGHPLFPLNSGVVRQLARKYLREGDIFKFDPRRLINRLLRDTIINHRDLWENGSFPPGNFHNFDLNALDVDVSRHIREKTPEADHKRIAALVYHWGDDPRTPGEAAAMDVRLYEAFGLAPVDWQAEAQIRARAAESTAAPRGPAEDTPETQDPLGPWRDILDNWRKDGRVSQVNANKLRGFLADALNSWLDADALLLKRISLENKHIGLPNVEQGLQVTPIAVAASDEDLENNSKSDAFFAAMRAVVRFHNARSWDYQGGEVDSACYAALIGRMAKQAEQWFARQGSGLSSEAVKPLAQALLIGARLLNLEGASSNDNADNLAAMLNPGPPNSGPPAEATDKWNSARRKAMLARKDMLERLLDRIAARQGGGGEQAIDAARLLEAASELRKNAWQLPKELDLDWFRELSQPSKEHLRELKSRLPDIVESRQGEVRTWLATVVEAFGEDFDLQTVIQTAKGTIKEARDTGLFRWSGGTAETLRGRFDSLGPVKNTADLAASAIREGADFGVSLSSLAQLDEQCMARTSQAISDYRRFLSETESIAKEQVKDTPKDLDEITSALDSDLQSLSESWAQITVS